MLRALVMVTCLVAVWAAATDKPSHPGLLASGPPPSPAIAPTPPMGWDAWNTFGCDVDEQKIHNTAEALVRSGMRDAGYHYVVLDDCWFAPQRDESGHLQANPRTFPHGMKALGDYLHARGLEFGIYMDPNDQTCAQYNGTYPGRTGSGGHEKVDADTFASWGVDYLKYDWCSPGGSLQQEVHAFATMRDALRSTGRSIVYSINSNSDFPGSPGEIHDFSDVATMSRTMQDIGAIWDTGHHNENPNGVRNIIGLNGPLAGRAGPGHWNDPDMLEVGVFGVNGMPGLTAIEERTHLSMWAMMAAPLIAGNDVTSMSDETRAVLLNREVIAVDQDPLGRQGGPVRGQGQAQQVWAKPLADGSVAIALYNQADQPAEIGATAGQLGLRPSAAYRAHDLWSGQEWVNGADFSSPVPAHGVRLLRVSTANR